MANASANRNLTQMKFGQSIEKKDSLRTGIASKAAGKRLFYANIKVLFKGNASLYLERFFKLIFLRITFS